MALVIANPNFSWGEAISKQIDCFVRLHSLATTRLHICHVGFSLKGVE